jgi:hypothetical protein
MKNFIIICVLIELTGCTQFAASVGGTFIGNIASDQYIKSHENKDVKVVDKSRRKK